MSVVVSVIPLIIVVCCKPFPNGLLETAADPPKSGGYGFSEFPQLASGAKVARGNRGKTALFSDVFSPIPLCLNTSKLCWDA